MSDFHSLDDFQNLSELDDKESVNSQELIDQIESRCHQAVIDK
jgi:hypothetical protein